jgi:NADH-quinone oxidoreductase subunit E
LHLSNTAWKERVDDLFIERGKSRESLLPGLEIIQDCSHYVSREAIGYLRDNLNVSSMDIYGVISFYGMLTTVEQGKYVIRLCDSLNCHLNEAGHIREVVEEELGIKDGETLQNGQFTLDVVPCLGLCDQSPAMMINEDIYTNLTEQKVRDILMDLKG